MNPIELLIDLITFFERVRDDAKDLFDEIDFRVFHDNGRDFFMTPDKDHAELLNSAFEMVGSENWAAYGRKLCVNNEDAHYFWVPGGPGYALDNDVCSVYSVIEDLKRDANFLNDPNAFLDEPGIKEAFGFEEGDDLLVETAVEYYTVFVRFHKRSELEFVLVNNDGAEFYYDNEKRFMRLSGNGWSVGYHFQRFSNEDAVINENAYVDDRDEDAVSVVVYDIRDPADLKRLSDLCLSSVSDRFVKRKFERLFAKIEALVFPLDRIPECVHDLAAYARYYVRSEIVLLSAIGVVRMRSSVVHGTPLKKFIKIMNEGALNVDYGNWITVFNNTYGDVKISVPVESVIDPTVDYISRHRPSGDYRREFRRGNQIFTRSPIPIDSGCGFSVRGHDFTFEMLQAFLDKAGASIDDDDLKYAFIDYLVKIERSYERLCELCIAVVLPRRRRRRLIKGERRQSRYGVRCATGSIFDRIMRPKLYSKAVVGWDGMFGGVEEVSSIFDKITEVLKYAVTPKSPPYHLMSLDNLFG